MVGTHARLQRGKDKSFAALCDLKDRAAAVTDIKIADAVKGDASCNSHAGGKLGHRPVRSHAIYGPVITRAHIHVAFVVKGDASGVHHLGQKWFYLVIGIDLVHRYRNLLSASPGNRSVDIGL